MRKIKSTALESISGGGSYPDKDPGHYIGEAIYEAEKALDEWSKDSQSSISEHGCVGEANQ